MDDMTVKIHFPKHNTHVTAKEGDTLLDAIRSAGLPIEAVCSGHGVCGKCLVIVNGEEKLACNTPAEDGMHVELLSSHDGLEILTDHSGGGKSASLSAPESLPEQEGTRPRRTAIAIDIGTTTVVIKALDPDSGIETGIRAFTNPQRIFGADVLSRINHSMDDASELSKLIRESVDAAIKDIIAGDTLATKQSTIEKIVIAGNTTMMYLLLNLRCRSLGLVPFEPEYNLSPSYSYKEVFETETLSCPVILYPYISAFVGGDIVSGMVNIERHMETGENPSFILVDMGTNGEIAYRNGGRLITTSTAAGPALEGGNITCGMSGLPGAIYEAVYEGEGRFSCKTIGGRKAAGICGSGVISIAAVLLDAGLINETGAFTDEAERLAESQYPDSNMKQFNITEDIIFTQKDVREFQLAKGAVRAGIDIVIEEMGALPDRLYLAGGFGQNIDLESAFRVGLIPKELKGKIQFAGNTALGGCVDLCMDDPSSSPMDALPLMAAAEEINLGSHRRFNDKFMETMMFEEL